ncbi:UNKNOWN [Stylonychia lemnae]|uniref:Uncharacterized protein n=1 Tax=Stylonychia lemnae TaxID=5949 RepID=A0A078AHT1_STYLE|nr:UNKNOWN [Stylonychia lemnae]|eukprot:CDW81809.1 UNKNOWN [Stylonychia lemnae]
MNRSLIFVNRTEKLRESTNKDDDSITQANNYTSITKLDPHYFQDQHPVDVLSSIVELKIPQIEREESKLGEIVDSHSNLNIQFPESKLTNQLKKPLPQ